MNGAAIAGGGSVPTVGAEWQIGQVADLNGDGRSDVVWRSTAGDVYVWQMNGTAIASSGPVQTVGAEWQVAP